MSALHSWLPIDLWGREEPDAQPSLSGLLYPGGLHLIYGEPDVGKSWLCLALTMEQLQAGQHVVLVAFERRQFRARLLALGATEEDFARLHYFEPSEPLTDPQALADVAALLDTYTPALIIFDAMAGGLALHSFDGNSNADVETFYSVTLAPFRAIGAAVVVVDHVTKDRETRGRWAIGAQRKLGGVEVGLLVEPINSFGRGQTGLVRLRVTKDTYGQVRRAEFELASDAETGNVTYAIRAAGDETGEGDRDHWRPTVLMERVFAFVSDQTTPVSRNTIERGVTGNGRWIRVAIDELLREGTFEVSPGPRGAQLISLATASSSTSCREREDVDAVNASTSSDLVLDVDTDTDTVSDDDEPEVEL
jgi:hypothetical protein